jgi:hypothetical protein
VPKLVEQGIAVLGMKPFAGGTAHNPQWMS